MALACPLRSRITKVLASQARDSVRFEKATGSDSSPRNTSPRPPSQCIHRFGESQIGNSSKKCVDDNPGLLAGPAAHQGDNAHPTARWRLGSRARSNLSGFSNCRSSRLADARTASTSSPHGIADSALRSRRKPYRRTMRLILEARRLREEHAAGACCRLTRDAQSPHSPMPV